MVNYLDLVYESTLKTDNMMLLHEATQTIEESGGFIDKKTKTNFFQKIRQWIKKIINRCKYFYYNTLKSFKDQYIGRKWIISNMFILLALSDEVYDKTQPIDNVPDILGYRASSIEQNGLIPTGVVLDEGERGKTALNNVIKSVQSRNIHEAMDLTESLLGEIGSRHYQLENEIDIQSKEELRRMVINDRLNHLAYNWDGDDDFTDKLIKGDIKSLEKAVVEGYCEGVSTTKMNNHKVSIAYSLLVTLYYEILTLKKNTIEFEDLFQKFETEVDRFIKRTDDENDLKRVHKTWSILNTFYTAHMQTTRVAIDIVKMAIPYFEDPLIEIFKATKEHHLSKKESVEILKKQGRYEEILSISVEVDLAKIFK